MRDTWCDVWCNMTWYATKRLRWSVNCKNKTLLTVVKSTWMCEFCWESWVKPRAYTLPSPLPLPSKLTLLTTTTTITSYDQHDLKSGHQHPTTTITKSTATTTSTTITPPPIPCTTTTNISTKATNTTVYLFVILAHNCTKIAFLKLIICRFAELKVDKNNNGV